MNDDIKPNIIAFSASHGCGKSTAAYNLASKLKLNGKNVAVIDELARECPLPINQTATELTQYWILAAQIKKEIKLRDKYDYVIVDRSVFDTLAYAITLKIIDLKQDQLISSYIKKYYHTIFVLDPIEFNFQVADGVRDLDPAFRMAVHNNLISLYEKYNINYTYVYTKEELNLHIEKQYFLKKEKRENV